MTRSMEPNGGSKTHKTESTNSSSSKKGSRSPFTLLKTLNQTLIKFFYSFGHNVGVYPTFYIIVPIVVSIALTTGNLFVKFEEEPMALFVPLSAPFREEKMLVDKYFPIDYDNFSASRFTKYEGHSRVVVTAKDDGSILRSALWPEIMLLDESLRNLSITTANGTKLDYSDMCAKWQGNCGENIALNLNEYIYEIENGSMFINYPLMVVPLVLPQLLGGIVVNESAGSIDDAKAILLGYFLDVTDKEDIKTAHEYELVMLDYLNNLEFEHIRVSYYTSRSLEDEIRKNMDSSLPYIPLTGVVMVLTCMGLLWMKDCVRSKPLIGLVGIVSAVMATGASFGFLIYCGAIFSRLNVVALFLVLGIGVDDVFVVISAWQKTSLKDPVPKRLAETYSEAAVSVTITSLTNSLAFACGTTMPVLIVRSFCLYCGVTIVFAYLWFITFCGGFLALAGRLEEQGRHSLFFFKVKPRKQQENAGGFQAACCWSEVVRENNQEPLETTPHVVAVFFRDTVGDILCNKVFQGFALLSFIIYISGAIYGCTVLQEGLLRDRMTRDDSYLVKFSIDENTLFRKFPYSIQVIMKGDIMYSDPETQDKILALEKKFENLPHGDGPIFTQSWLRSFLRRLRRKKAWREQIVDEKSFIKILREEYFKRPGNVQSLDLSFNEDYSRILASRMVFQSANVKDVYDDIVMMNSYRKVAEESEFDVNVFHILFSLFDQNALLKALAIQSILIAAVLVMFVSLLFIPYAWGAIALSSSILSIAIGVIGYMAFWGINLDQVSAGSIFMCIGFSVDFSAHINYTYLSCKAKTVEEKIRFSMFSLGLPILQGGITTVLSLSSFLLVPGYSYRTIFKTIFLVTVFAIYHSIILIPLFLALLETISIKCSRNKKKYSPEKHEKHEINGNNGISTVNGSMKQLTDIHAVQVTPSSPARNVSNGSLTQLQQRSEVLENEVDETSRPYTNGHGPIQVDRTVATRRVSASKENGGVDNDGYVYDISA